MMTTEQVQEALAVARAEERERCAKAIEEYGERCIAEYGGTMSEMLTFTLCAEHVRQLAGNAQN